MPEGSAWSRFKEDLKDVRERYLKRTSVEHKRLVALILLMGAAVRIGLMLRPITADEALAYMSFARQPVGGLLTDYSLPLNHFLHTLLAKWSTGLFGVSGFTLRLPAMLAGMLALPLFYLFTRSMFNRYIALMALGLAAAFPLQAEVGALAHGYSLTWLALMLALVLGRHLAKENNPWTAVLLGVVLALGMWSHPSMIFQALLVLLWLLFALLGKYERSLNDRLAMLGLATGAFVLFTALLHLPVVITHGMDHLLNHLANMRPSWKRFGINYPDQALSLWVWITDPVSGWVGMLGFIALVHAAYISVKFRLLLLALVLGAVPLTIALRDASDPAQWAYALFVFHIGSAIALFYVLKFVQDRMFASFAKRGRTAVASLALTVALGLTALLARDEPERLGRMPEAAAAADFLQGAMAPNDRICAAPNWEPALQFELLARGIDAGKRVGPLAEGSTVFAAIAVPKGPGLQLALPWCGIPYESVEEPRLMLDWPRLEIFAARKR